MSNRQSTQIGVTFKPVPEPAVRAPGEWILIFGAICPAVIIGLELISHMCADAFFDPIPTYWHVAAVSLVPASNLLVWYHLQDETRRTTKWFVFANGVAIAIAGFYALLFLPLLPLALVGIIVGLGLPPLAPLASFVCALKLAVAIHEPNLPGRGSPEPGRMTSRDRQQGRRSRQPVAGTTRGTRHPHGTAERVNAHEPGRPRRNGRHKHPARCGNTRAPRRKACAPDRRLS